MEQTWRWWGPADSITLAQVRQTGATGLVTALHEVPYGDVWTRDAIDERLAFIDAAGLGLRWSVVESLQVHENIKLGRSDDRGHLPTLFANYRQSVENLAASGVRTICYNFMPVLDWARTDMRHKLPGGGSALRFNAHEFAAFDVCMLAREGAERDYPAEVVTRARAWWDAATQAERQGLLANIMAGLPGAFDRYDIEGLRTMLARFRDVTREVLSANLRRFLDEVIPTAERCGVKLAIHPDDPPRPLLGLPRIVTNEADIAALLDSHRSASNGLTLCTGSLGAGEGNDLPAIAARFAPLIHFAHLRNVAKDPDGSFMEADHLGGDTDMVAVVEVLLREQERRRAAHQPDWRIPFRPDHGHELLDDVGKPTHPGYPMIGRLRGLAEIRGVMTAVAGLRGWML